ncbi:MAG: hypothetical protein ACK4RF_13075, partial [Cyclobacteriaceae bacterium]
EREMTESKKKIQKQCHQKFRAIEKISHANFFAESLPLSLSLSLCSFNLSLLRQRACAERERKRLNKLSHSPLSSICSLSLQRTFSFFFFSFFALCARRCLFHQERETGREAEREKKKNTRNDLSVYQLAV